MKAERTHRAAGWLIAGALAAAGCHGAESFSFGLDAGNLFVSQGSGGAGGGAGGNVISGPGTGGGGNGNGGVTGSGGAPDLDGGDGDAGTAADVAPPPDALAREVRLPEGPFTPIDCVPIASYKADDQAYGPGTTIFSLRDLRVYRCMQGLQSGWCTLGAYEPGLDIGYWRDCWIPIGYCQ